MAVEALRVQRPCAAEAAVAAAAQQWAAVQHLPLERLAGLHLFLAQPQQHMQLTSAAGEVQPLMPDQAISAVAVVAPALQRRQLMLAGHLLCRLAVAVVGAQLPAAMRRVTAAQAVTLGGQQQPQAAAVPQDQHQRAETARMATAPSAVRAAAVARAMTLLLATLAATGAFPVAQEVEAVAVHPRAVRAAMALLAA
jgi:hypothetical protein